MRTAIYFSILCALTLCLSSCFEAPAVIQGKVLAVDEGAGTITVEDEKTAKPVDLVIRGAKIGSKPEPGDEVRVAYRVKDGRNVAHRLMNLSRQREVGKGGH